MDGEDQYTGLGRVEVIEKVEIVYLSVLKLILFLSLSSFFLDSELCSIGVHVTQLPKLDPTETVEK